MRGTVRSMINNDDIDEVCQSEVLQQETEEGFDKNAESTNYLSNAPTTDVYSKKTLFTDEQQRPP